MGDPVRPQVQVGDRDLRAQVLDDDPRHTHGDDLLGSRPESGFPWEAVWQIVKTYHLLTVAFVLIVLITFWRLKRRRALTTGTDYAAEANMNLTIRRARALEAMQREYDRKAREFEELQAKQRQRDAEERAARLTGAGGSSGSSGAAGPGGGQGGGGGGGGGGDGGASGPGGGGGGLGRSGGNRNDSDWTPLMGSGAVGGFRSQRCTKRGG